MLKLEEINGQTCLFWFHNWSRMGNLQYFLTGANSCLGIAKNVKLYDIHLNGRWLLRPARSDPQVFLQAHLSIVTLKNEDIKRFRTGLIYHTLISETETMPYKVIVWNSDGLLILSIFMLACHA